jgi:hypothetical protein
MSTDFRFVASFQAEYEAMDSIICVKLLHLLEDQYLHTHVFSNAEVTRPYKIPITKQMLSKELVGIHDFDTLGNSQDSLTISKPIAITAGYTDPMEDA